MTYLQPTLLSDALSALERRGARIIAGGTDFYPALKRGQGPEAFLDVTRIPGFAEISRSGEGYRFGAAVTWSDVVRAELPPAFDALKQAAREVGSLQIQNAGTIAGNICNASPAADGVPPFLALDAQVEIASSGDGVRTLPLADFITGVRRTALGEGELVTAVTVPAPPEGMTSAFEKLGSRRYLVISIVMTAANIVLDAEGRISRARIAVGACSPVAQRLRTLESDLVGVRPEEVAIGSSHLSPLAPIDDVRGSSAYRREAVAEQIRRAILKAAAA